MMMVVLIVPVIVVIVVLTVMMVATIMVMIIKRLLCRIRLVCRQCVKSRIEIERSLGCPVWRTHYNKNPELIARGFAVVA